MCVCVCVCVCVYVCVCVRVCTRTYVRQQNRDIAMYEILPGKLIHHLCTTMLELGDYITLRVYEQMRYRNFILPGPSDREQNDDKEHTTPIQHSDDTGLQLIQTTKGWMFSSVFMFTA